MNESLPDLEDDDSVFIVPDDEKFDKPIAPSAPPPLQMQAKRVSVLRSIRRHRLIAVLMFVLAWLVGIPVIYLRAIRPIWYTEAQLLLSPMFPKNLIEEREYQVPRYEEFVSQQLAMIVRDDITLDVLERLGDRRSIWARPGEGRRESAIRLSNQRDPMPVPNTRF